MSLFNPTYKTELATRLDYINAFLASHSDDYTEDGRLDVDALAEALAANYGILLAWALELVEQYRTGEDGR